MHVSSESRGEHGRMKAAFKHCVGIARNFETIVLDVAHMWNYTT
jgi:hypothetical protein